MAKLANIVHETTQSSGTLGPSNAITLLGAVAGFNTFDSQLSTSDTVIITVRDTTSGDAEVMKATFTSPSTLTPVATRIWSTDGGTGGAAINWPASGTRDVYVAAWAEALESLVDPDNQGTGLVARTAADTYTPRSIATDDATRLPITNGDGVSGNPTISGSWLAAKVLDRSASAAAAVRTMAQRLIHGAGEVVIGAANFEFWGDDGGTDKAARYTRSGANDWRADVQESSTWKRLVAVVAGAGAADAGKLVGLDGAGTSFEKGPSISGNAGLALVVNSPETGHEYGPVAVLETALATTSGTTKDWTLIPSWVTKITVMFDGVSTDGTDDLLVRVGDSGGFYSTSYTSTCFRINAAGINVTSSAAGFHLDRTASGDALYGHMILTRLGPTQWVASWTIRTATELMTGSGGYTFGTGPLDRVRITPAGADNFDAGLVNIRYE